MYYDDYDDDEYDDYDDEDYSEAVETGSCFPATIIEDEVSAEELINGMSEKTMRELLLQLSGKPEVRSHIIENFRGELTERQKASIEKLYCYHPWHSRLDEDASWYFMNQRCKDLDKEIHRMIDSGKYATALDLSVRLPLRMHSTIVEYIDGDDDEIWDAAVPLWMELTDHMERSKVFEAVYSGLSEDYILLSSEKLRRGAVLLCSTDDDRNRLIRLCSEYLEGEHVSEDGNLGEYTVFMLQLLEGMDGRNEEWQKIMDSNKEDFDVLSYLYRKQRREDHIDDAISTLHRMMDLPYLRRRRGWDLDAELIEVLEEAGMKEELLDAQTDYLMSHSQNDLKLYHKVRAGIDEKELKHLLDRMKEAVTCRDIMPDVLLEEGMFGSLYDLLKSRNEVGLYGKYSSVMHEHFGDEFVDVFADSIYAYASEACKDDMYDSVARYLVELSDIAYWETADLVNRIGTDFWRKRNLKKAIESKGFFIVKQK